MGKRDSHRQPKPPFMALSNNDKALWQSYIKTIKPIKQAAVVEIQPPSIQDFIHYAEQHHQRLMSVSLPLTLPLTLDMKTVLPKNKPKHKIKKSQTIDVRLDLHGLSQAEAYHEVFVFITRAFHNHCKTLLIITGKGYFRNTDHQGGILNTALPQWLNQAPLNNYISYYTHAHNRHGGTGAYYIFMKS